MTRNTLQAINLIDQQIAILFTNNWFQEDIIALRQSLLAKIPDHQTKEIILGADRESVRFQWQDAEFILNFDYYSQSCWFSAHDEKSNAAIQPLLNILLKS